MDNLNEIRPISMDEFLAQVITMKMEDWRLAQICAVRVENGYEMSYSFCKDYKMVTLRLVVGTEDKIPSITQMYSCAFIQENEASELFGVKIENLSLDYHRRLYRIDKETPFKEKG
ncbi:MAG TPA: NADH-quinone oxidoreductase subunit C [Candidatus Scybalocola faecavium]|nr:NADH-quinone oxidoreductase subunit C [Candidatus Scybalocola faecavium]